MNKTSCYVKGMHCASCVAIIKRKSDHIPGLKSIEVNLANNTADLEYEPEVTDIETINRELTKYGYELVSSNKEEQLENKESAMAKAKTEAKKELETLTRQVKVLFPLALIFFTLMMHHLTVKLGWLPVFFWERWLPQIGLIIATIVQFGYGQRFISSFLRFCRHGVADMNALVGMGTLTAYFYSATMVLFPELRLFLGLGEQLYFDVVIIVIGFITLGDYLVAKSKAKTGEALEKLMGLQVKTATVIRNKKEMVIPIEELKVGDIFLVKPGEKIAIDGQIVKGETAVDESMITGESLPIDKKEGDFVTGATINKQGALQVRATQIGEQTVLAQIIKAVVQAQNSKAPIQNLADKIVSVFVPIVLTIAIMTLLAWTVAGHFSIGLAGFIAVLIVACPCAMGLATPMAVIVGVGKAAENGILVKDAQSLQKLSEINYVVFDKTGTITHGQPKVVATTLKAESDWLALWALEKNSEHPLATALIREAEKKTNLKKRDNVEVKKFSVLPGRGVTGIISGEEYWAGNEKLILELKIKYDETELNEEKNQGRTPIFLVKNKQVLGLAWLADTIKKEAIEVIKDLNQKGIKTALLTGDRASAAAPIADQAGFTQVFAEVLPTEKSDKVKELQDEGYIVAMIGDGINDAPALSQADVGIAMGTGTDIAMESANLTLLGGKIGKLPLSLEIAQATMRTIKQNLFFSFVYNMIAIPIAAGLLFPIWGILLNPAIEGAAMAFSSLSVVLNSLRLKSKTFQFTSKK